MRNNGLILTGDIPRPYTHSRLFDQRLSQLSTRLAPIENLDLTYNKTAAKNVRLHSKKTQWLLECMHLLNFSTIKKSYSSERIGIYICGPHYNMDDQFPDYPLKTAEPELVNVYRGHIPPTHGIRNHIGIVPGHICIFHEIHGPSFVITSPQPELIFQKAWMDLQGQEIDLAVVGLVNIYEDPYLAAWHALKNPESILTEAAGVFFMDKSSDRPLLKTMKTKEYYGYLDGLLV